MKDFQIEGEIKSEKGIQTEIETERKKTENKIDDYSKVENS